MKLRARWGWALAALLVLVAAAFYLLVSSAPNLPVYQGKTFYQWADDLQQAQSDYTAQNRWQQIEVTSAAIRAMGTNGGLELAMADLRARITLKGRIITWLAPRARFLKLKPPDIPKRWVRGIRAMEVLGPLGKPYLPELVTMVSNSTGYSEPP